MSAALAKRGDAQDAPKRAGALGAGLRAAPREVLRGIGRAYPLMIVAVLWESVARLSLVRPIFLPPLSQVIADLPVLWADGSLLGPLLVTFLRAAAGLAIAVALGLAIGLAMARSPWVKRMVDPLLAVGFPAPKVAFLPILILWFGVDHLSKVAIVALTCVFPCIIAAETGARAASRVLLWAAQALGTPPLGMLWRVVLPAALPSLLSGLRVAVPYALVSALTAEMISGGGGLGGGLVYAQRYFETPTVFALLLVVLVFGYALDHAMLLLRQHLLRWHADRT